MKSILIIVPAHNEEAVIAQTLKKITEGIKNDETYTYDILVVDDASHDNTRKIVKNLGFKLISLPVNLGIGGAVQTGYVYAAERGYSAVVQVDGDGQHEPKDIPHLLHILFNQDCHMVIGSRFIQKTDYTPNLPRQIGMLFSRIMLYMATKKRIHDTTSGFRAVRHELYHFYTKHYPLEFAGVIPIAIALKKNFKLIETKANFYYRSTGTSTFNLKKSIYYPFQTCLALIGVLIQKL